MKLLPKIIISVSGTLARVAFALIAGTITAMTVHAQEAARKSPLGIGAVVTVSGDSADRTRLNQLQGLAPSARFLLRSTSQLMIDRDTANTGFLRLVLPRIDFVRNSALPYGENDGSMWPSKGSNVRTIAGFEASLGILRLVVLPEFSASANESFDYTQLYDPGLPPSRKQYSSPWNVYPYSIDAPVRFGAEKVRRVAPGQSSVYVAVGGAEAGVATDNEWWGPGIRTAILMSDNAEGIPRLFLRTRNPWRTRAGDFEARWMLGGLTESSWFDFDSTNNLRSISAIALTWSPRIERDLTLGFARAVFAPATGWSEIAGRVFDAYSSAGRPNARAIADTVFRPGKDQLFSLFGRWVFPSNGLETYAEWARAEMPRSFRDFLLAPNNTQGYTIGLQWVHPAGAGRVRLQAEHSYLEQSPTFRDRPLGSFYTSRAVVQGYTNRGQVIGAGMGQGSSGEWIAMDYLKGWWQVGTFAARTRFNNDAYSLLPWLQNSGYCQHDVTISPGVRGGIPTPLGRFSMQYTSSERMNAFFQNLTACSGAGPRIGVRNGTLAITFTAGG